jgi:hypothetical protein
MKEVFCNMAIREHIWSFDLEQTTDWSLPNFDHLII